MDDFIGSFLKLTRMLFSLFFEKQPVLSASRNACKARRAVALSGSIDCIHLDVLIVPPCSCDEQVVPAMNKLFLHRLK